ncbi:hypothetical protein P7D22_16745 [Lichenihabitans sp. Uapishka_5]|uniref:hypothetical protein n=1 Tax=Lichenihabitans sp. Uapishka_5 TaxID=3037302 RepID=UPI0029E7FDF0|nr:hypothetical protein [Lichenihabitans sp. Uapishka_5]MDX7952818.1 hypothetical protein [Lichenihabitans sp. Uapishka_5]
MRRSTDHVLHAIKDGIRTVRYTIRAEVETPGAALPKSVASIELAPFIAAGSVVGTPALRAVDGILTQVESLAADVVRPQGRGGHIAVSIDAFLAPDASFSDLLYEPYKRLLAAHAIRNALVSEHALDRAQDGFQARQGNGPGSSIAAACASLTLALAEARPIRKIDVSSGAGASPPMMLAPNLYCGAVLGLVTALVSRDPALHGDIDAVQDSVISVVDVRFDRFKQALSGKSPAAELTDQFEALMPFLP